MGTDRERNVYGWAWARRKTFSSATPVWWVPLSVLVAASCALSPTASEPAAPLQVRSARLPVGAELAYGAFTSGAMDLYLVAAGDEKPRLLAGDWPDESHPAWSPDGLRVAFVSNSYGQPILRVLDVATGMVADIVSVPPRAGSPIPNATGPLSWSPDSQIVAFSSPLAGDADLWLATTDGSGRAGLLVSGPGTQAAPAWSPDGSRLAYACPGPEGPTDLDICIATAEGTEAIHLTSGPGQDSDPSWSPDGLRIAYSSRPPCSDTINCLVAEIYSVAVDGGQPENLSGATEDDYGPAWAPNGALIAFTRNHEIWLMAADGSDQAPLLAGQWPAWRP